MLKRELEAEVRRQRRVIEELKAKVERLQVERDGDSWVARHVHVQAVADLQNEVARLKGSTTDAVETVVQENERLRGELEHVRGELVRQNELEDAAHNAIQERDFCARQATRAQAKLDAFVALAKSMEVDT